MSALGIALLTGCGNKDAAPNAAAAPGGASATGNAAAIQQTKPSAAQSTDLAPAPSGASTDLSGGRK